MKPASKVISWTTACICGNTPRSLPGASSTPAIWRRSATTTLCCLSSRGRGFHPAVLSQALSPEGRGDPAPAPAAPESGLCGLYAAHRPKRRRRRRLHDGLYALYAQLRLNLWPAAENCPRRPVQPLCHLCQRLRRESLRQHLQSLGGLYRGGLRQRRSGAQGPPHGDLPQLLAARAPLLGDGRPPANRSGLMFPISRTIVRLIFYPPAAFPEDRH